ncbi:MAG: alpha/beta fold hydrolase [Acidimicrobiales bacterium]
MAERLRPSIEGFDAGYVDVAGLATWHEVRGEGPAVVLLHGGFSGAAGWALQAPALVKAGFRVHAPERRAHGHTADVEGPLSYAVMAKDTIDYLEVALGERAHLVGWSDGAVVALLVAQLRPDLVDRVVLIGQYFNSSGRVENSELMALLRTDDAKDFLRRSYDPISPDGPDHFDVVYDKMLAMIDSDPEIDLDSLGGVCAPTLVIQGDRDEVMLDHSAAVAASLTDGRLAVLPGSHLLPIELPEVVNCLLVAFLHDHVPCWRQVSAPGRE